MLPQRIGTTTLFLDVCAKPGDLSKSMKNGCKVLDIFLEWSHEDGCIIRIAGRPQNISSSTNFVKEPMRSGDVEDLREWVDGKDKKKN
jgi:hypothetical protein